MLIEHLLLVYKMDMFYFDSMKESRINCVSEAIRNSRGK